MAFLRLSLCLALFAGAIASSVDVTPVEKVINLISDMKDKVVSEGKAEAKTYNTFACFCQKLTLSKSSSAKKSKETIDDLSASIAEETTEKEGDQKELSERKADQEKMKKEKSDEEVRLAKETAAYEEEEADMVKAIVSLEKAIAAMANTGGTGAALLSVSVRENLQQTIKIAQAMNMIKAPQHKAVASLLQGKASVDPSDPEYEYHSQGIIDTMNELLGEFKDAKKDLDEEFGKTKKGALELIASLGGKISANSDSMKNLDRNIEKLIKSIAQDRGLLVEEDATLKDTELYLKDLTERCEARANDWDQRSQMRNDEITALTQALDILKDKVKSADEEANERAMFLQRRHRNPKPAVKKEEKKVAKVEKVEKVEKAPAKVETAKATPAVKKAISLIQEASENHAGLRGKMTLSEAQRVEKAVKSLIQSGSDLSSLTLTSFAAKVAADPFKKVKGLIQKLIERLLEESKAEATKKGFCDTELGKARKDRDYRREESLDLNAELSGLEAKRDALDLEISELTDSIKAESDALKEATKLRKEEKDENLETISTAKEGYSAVTDALAILKKFYKQAAKASLVQLAASPVDEDAPEVASGSYKGSQSASKAVLGLLETISSDFDRTIRTTTKAEAEASAEYTSYAMESKASIKGKETKKELDEQDLKSTKTTIKIKFDDLETAQDLLDKALMELEELKPTCLDSGMSYAERVEKREAEMEALKKALCILDPEGVESMCGLTIR